MRILSDKLRAKMIDWLLQDIDEPRLLPLSDFERIQYEVRPCDVLLIEGRTRVSSVIRMITQSTWSHAALYIGRIHDIDNHELRARILQHYHGNIDAQLVVESILGKGIIVSPLTDYSNEHIRICRPHGITRKDAQQVITFVINRLGLRYDVRQTVDLARFLLPWRIFPRRWRSSLFTHNAGISTRESCSSLIAEAFHAVDFPILPVLEESQHAGLELVQRNPRLFTPSDFDYSPFFEIIKYPIIEIGGSAAYRKLPWKQGALSDDDGHVFIAPENNKSIDGFTLKEPLLETTPRSINNGVENGAENGVEQTTTTESEDKAAEKIEVTKSAAKKKSKTRRILEFFD